MATSFKALGTGTGNGSSNTFTFSSIPQTYKHLWIIGGIQTTANAQIYARLNNDSGGNYILQEIYSGGSTVENQVGGTYSRASGNAECIVNSSNGAASIEMIIPNYTSNEWKQVIWESGSGQYSNSSAHGINVRSTSTWKNTSAVTSLVITLSSGSFASGSKITLYGLD